MNSKIKSNSISNSEYEELIKKTISFEQKKEKSIVDGTVVSIERDNIIIDIGLKSEGRIALSEFTRQGQSPEINIGDSFKVYIDRLDGHNGETKLSREKAVKQASWNKLEQCYTKGDIVVGIPFNRVKGGLSVDIDGVIAFLPGSQVDSRQIVNDTKELLNKPMDLIILKMDKYRGNIVVSRKAISDLELKEQREKLLADISEGSIINGKVKNITDYGAFIDLGGIDGLVHVTDVAWKKINHPSEILTLGSEIKVKVLKYDQEATRISLGVKQLTPDPWDDINNEFKVNENYSAQVKSINDYGIALSFNDKFDGFVQLQDLSWLKKPSHPSKFVQPDESIKIKLLEIDNEKKRLICGVKQLKENPWENILKKHNVGDTIETEIVNKVDFGIFVKIYEEVDGMVHISDLAWSEEESAATLKNLKKSDKIKVKILDIDKQKERISLSVKQLTDSPFASYIKENPIKSIVSGKIVSIIEKGLNIKLNENITGFVKKSNLSKNKNEQKTDRFAEGEIIDSMIISVDDKLRKINLSIKDKEDYEEKEVLNQYGSSDSGASLGDILGDALNKKKNE